MDGKDNLFEALYEANLILRGTSACLATIGLCLKEGNVKPSDEMLGDALYSLEVQIDQVIESIELHDERELSRFNKISQRTGIPFNELISM